MQIGGERCVVGGAPIALTVPVAGAVHTVDIGVAAFAEWHVTQAEPVRTVIDSVVQVEADEGNFG